MGYVGGNTIDKKKAFYYSLLFCLGQIIMFTALGIIGIFVGRIFLGIQIYWYIFLGGLMIVMALQIWNIIDILPKISNITFLKDKGILGALLMGIIAAIFMSACSMPVLIGITAIVSTKNNLLIGCLMLLYGIGHCAMSLIAGTSVGFVNGIIKTKKKVKIGMIIKIIFGIMLVILAIYFFYSAFTL